MTNHHRDCLSPFLLLLLAILPTGALALTPTEWQYRQKINVTEPGLKTVLLPAGTFDSAQPTLSDLRLLGPDGQEVPYVLDRELSSRREPPARTVVPKSFHSSTSGDATEMWIETGTSAPLDAIDLETPAPFFLKAAHVDISSDGAHWESVGPASPVFRQFGTQQLRISLGHRTAAYVRVTLDDFHTRKVNFSGAKLLRAPSAAEPPVLAPLGARILRRDEFAGKTLLTVELEGRHVPLAGLILEVKDPLFMRNVSVSIREAKATESSERIVGSGTIYRVDLEGAPARSQLVIPLDFLPPTRELLVAIQNGDSPPLTFEGVQAQQHPVHLLFNAPVPGHYTLLSGNQQVAPPRYDLAFFSGDLRTADAMSVVPEGAEATPHFQPRTSLSEPPLPDIPLAGAHLDLKPWAFVQAMQITTPGVQELELTPGALARAMPGGADLRILHRENQIPYLLEHPSLSRSLTITPVPTADPKRPSTSRWKLSLPEAGLPIQQITLTTTTPLFQRQFRIYQEFTTPDGRTIQSPLSSGDWTRTPDPGIPQTKTLSLSDRLQGDTIWLETENGDNPPISLGPVQGTYPVVRLVFKVQETEGFSLAYGNPAAKPPRYDLDLVAAKLLTSTRQVARLATRDPDPPAPHWQDSAFLFWGALALVVVVLLIVVAKLLPKPPDAA